MKAFFILSLVILSGCGQTPVIDLEIRPYIKDFQDAATAHGVNVDLTHLTAKIFVLSSIPALGVCYVSGNNSEVYFDKSFWENSSYFTRELLVFHELGHCILHRNHNNTTYSLMYEYFLGEDFYRPIYQLTLDELFHPN